VSDPLRELNEEFAQKQRESETCGDADCYAPKFEEIPTEAGIPIAVCGYHYIELQFAPEDKENKSYDFFGVGFQELKHKTQKYNEKISGENSEEDTQNKGDEE